MRKMSEREFLARKTKAAIDAFRSQRLRWVTGRSQAKVEIDEKRYRQVVDSIMHDEVERHMLIGAIKEKGPLTVEELSQLTDLHPSTVVKHIIALRYKGVVREAGEKSRQYLYKLV